MFCNLHHAYAVNWQSSQLKISALVCGNEMASVWPRPRRRGGTNEGQRCKDERCSKNNWWWGREREGCGVGIGDRQSQHVRVRDTLTRERHCNRLPRLPPPCDSPPCFLTSYVSLPMSHYLFPLPIADCKRCLPRQLYIIIVIFLPPTSCIYRL